MEKNAKIYVAGHRGLVGSALVRALRVAGYSNLVYRTSAELDLCEQDAVRDFFQAEKPEYVFLAAAKVGGIHANKTYPAAFIYTNLQIQTHVIDSAWRSGCKKLLFLGSSCIYPKLCPQPIKEEYLLSGPLEPTNEWYALAKIAGIKMCQAYRSQYGFNAISAMPTNLYGPGDNFHPENSHVMPAMIRRFHEAKESGAQSVVIWGTGKPRREFLHVDDLANALLYLMLHYEEAEHINIGCGSDQMIMELAQIIAATVGFTGKIEINPEMPDGTPQKLLDISRIIALGWKPAISLQDGVAATYSWYLDNKIS